MKILCTTDFSNTSINAINWVIAYIQSCGGGEIEILHCLNLRSRANMKLKIDELIIKDAKEDFARLIQKIKKSNLKNVKVNTKISRLNPKYYIPKRAKKLKVDFIAIGTTGLSNLKNITIGSVTEYVVKHASAPIISIPNKAIFTNFNRVVLGVDKKTLKKQKGMSNIKKFFAKKKVKMFFAQVNKSSDDKLKFDDAIFEAFSNYKYEVKQLKFSQSISQTLNSYVKKVDAQILCIIHHKRNWFNSLFHHSVLKEELFNQKLPLLIIPD